MCNNLFISMPVAAEEPVPQTPPTNPLNRMCASLDVSGNRVAFLANEDEYCLKFGLTRRQRRAVKNRDFLQMIDAGGHLIYLDRLAALVR